jgi:hypothetical protein
LAILQLTLADIRDEIRRRVGEKSGTVTTGTPHLTDAELLRQVNMYMQRLPRRVSALSSEHFPHRFRPRSLTSPTSGVAGELKLDMWHTFGDLTETSGSSTVHLPVDYDKYESFWDQTNGRELKVVSGVEKYWRKRKYHRRADTNRVGPPEAIEIMDFVSNSGTWQRRALLHPDTPSGVTPDIRMYYWRLPAVMASDSDKPDIDIKCQDLTIYGPILDFYREDDPAYERYLALERELLAGLSVTAMAV